MADRTVNHRATTPTPRTADAADPYCRFRQQVLTPLTSVQRVRSATTPGDLTASDLAWLLRHAMMREGVKPFSEADNILAHLRERLESGASGACHG
jgi:hypothetical protein